MREFIRHPSEIPISVDLDHITSKNPEHLKDISYGGLSFHSSEKLEEGTIVNLSIPLIEPKFVAQGSVVWCQQKNGDFIVGVRFMDERTNFKLRMVEQVCHIEKYKEQMLKEEGRILTSEEAAVEWIEKYAADFPRTDERES